MVRGMKQGRRDKHRVRVGDVSRVEKGNYVIDWSSTTDGKTLVVGKSSSSNGGYQGHPEASAERRWVDGKKREDEARRSS